MRSVRWGKSLDVLKVFYGNLSGGRDRTWTCTSFTSQPPQGCAYTNSATRPNMWDYSTTTVWKVASNLSGTTRYSPMLVFTLSHKHSLLRYVYGAEGGTWTHTLLREQPSEDCESTNSSTSAYNFYFLILYSSSLLITSFSNLWTAMKYSRSLAFTLARTSSLNSHDASLPIPPLRQAAIFYQKFTLEKKK